MSQSLRVDRDRLLAALSGLVVTTPDGVAHQLTGSRSVPADVVAWQGWPVAEGSSWDNRCVATTRWRVYVALPSGDALAAADGYDAIHDGLGPELGKLGRVEDTAPAAWPVGPQEAVPVLQATVVI